MDQEEFVVAAPVPLDRVDPILEAGRHVFGEQPGLVTRSTQCPLELEHLGGDGIAHRRAGVELVDATEAGHFVAQIT
jgi:hypothetical protein